MRWGPQMPFSHAKLANKAIVWIVLPSPISSAKIPPSTKTGVYEQPKI